jgi:hypothetical protein
MRSDTPLKGFMILFWFTVHFQLQQNGNPNTEISFEYF